MCRNDCEPTLEEMLSDPMTQALMESDGVDAARVKDLLLEARERCQPEPSRPRRR